MTRTDWRSRANCLGIDPEIFYPKRGESTAAARSMCEACPVQKECRESAVYGEMVFGILGNTSPNQRAAMRSDNRASEATT